ncbi:hypothetical protein JQ628_24045 [Bradyrhizobium lablabi]|uniref:hypothetical protein n=1 Tax=Bradyrhizobium lablabi TaxID=722472 RepID=UPI001BA5982C|nr:hypothetical protein [Bradyrhizobium lablabi]MBR1124617.1 hypothetical protein [Bradyrhizobium lablabi]
MNGPSFYRYTNLAATIHMLRTRNITLLNPGTWDDTNDSYFMSEYKRLKNAKSVLALCFAESEESYHHWRVFSSGADGVRVEFDKQALLAALTGDGDVRAGLVNYTKLEDLKQKQAVACDELPFLKRWPYGDEREFRVVYTSLSEAVAFKNYPIALSSIRRITLSPWLPKALSDSVKAALKSIDGCSRLKVFQSTLISNEAWKKFTERAQ